MNDWSKWEELFGDNPAPGPPPDSSTDEERPPQPVDDHPITFVILNGEDHIQHVTGLRGTWTETGGFVVPFASFENAIDCLRVIRRGLENDSLTPDCKETQP